MDTLQSIWRSELGAPSTHGADVSVYDDARLHDAWWA
jgi:hypothetical protein